MIRTQDARDRINDLLRLDNRNQIRSHHYTIQALTFIRAHLGAFIERYGQDNGLTLAQASQAVNNWDVLQWRQAIDNFDMSQWPQSALNRIRAVGAYAAINKGHLITGIALIALIANSVKNHRDIIKRLGLDGKTQVNRLRNGMHLRHYYPKINLNLHNWEKNFWADNDKLSNDVEQLINKNIRHGYTVRRLDKTLVNRFNKSKNPNVYIGDRIDQTETDTEKILRTESSRLINSINMNTYKLANVQLVDWVTMPGACKYCLSIEDDNPYSLMSVPSCPYHPNCRCLISIHNDHNSNLIVPNMLF